MTKYRVPFLFITLLTTSVAFAEIHEAVTATAPEKYETKPHLDKELITADDPRNNDPWGVFVSAEFLYQYGRLNGLEYATKGEVVLENDVLFPNNVVQVGKGVERVKGSWDPGLRLSLGIDTSHDDWDVSTNWTYIYNRADDSISVAPFNDDFTTVLTNPLGTKTLTNWWDRDADAPATSLKAVWRLQFNQIDTQVGRYFCASKYFSVRPFAGVRGAWNRNYFRVKGSYENRGIPGQIETNRNRWSQKFWGVGLLAGLESVWHFNKNWSIFGTGDIALLLGKFDLKKQESLLIQNNVATRASYQNTFRDDYYDIQPNFDLAIGIRAEFGLSEDRFHLGFDLGWEEHLWLDFNRLLRSMSDDPDMLIYQRQDGNLSLSGLVARARFDF